MLLLFLTAGRHEYVQLNTEVNELSRTNRTSRRIAHDELSVMEQNAAKFRLAVREHQRVAPRCSQSSGIGWILQIDLKKALGLELRQAQLNKESAALHRERDILLRLGNEAQERLRQQNAHTVHERLSNPVSQERDLVRQRAQHLRDNCQVRTGCAAPQGRS